MVILNTFWGWLFLISAALVLVMLIMSIISGTDLDIDLDGDGMADFDLGTIVSPKGVLHFIFGGSGYLSPVHVVPGVGIAPGPPQDGHAAAYQRRMEHPH